MVRSCHKRNILCMPWSNLTLKSSVCVWLIWWNCSERRQVDGNARKFRRFFILYLTILYAAKCSQVKIYLVKVVMYCKTRFLFIIWYRASIKNITTSQKCCMKIETSNLWVFFTENSSCNPALIFSNSI